MERLLIKQKQMWTGTPRSSVLCFLFYSVIYYAFLKLRIGMIGTTSIY